MALKDKERKRIERVMAKKNIKENKGKFIFYILIRLFVIGMIVIQVLNRNFENVFVCVLTLILFMIPAFVERGLKIELPNTLEVMIILFIFAAEILGEINEFYVLIPGWDTMLHTINGFLMAAIGFSLVDIFNRSERTKFFLSPVFLAVVAFCFSMTIGVLWEFFEFGADMLLHTDMQKDTFVTQFASVSLHPEGRNIPIPVNDITQTVIKTADGTVYTLGAYLDIGLIDTMKDLIVNFFGAVAFSIIGFFYIKSRGKNKFADRFIPKLMPEDDGEHI
ncbi:MAG: hypothetical protein ACLVDF_04195 [Acutalibacteraceae bacterium]